MKQTTEAEMLKRPAEVMKWVYEGEPVEICRDGVVVARLMPVGRVAAENANGSHDVDWSDSWAFRDRTGEHLFTDEEVRSLLG